MNCSAKSWLPWVALVSLAAVSPLLALWFGAAEMPSSTILGCLQGECPSSIDHTIFFDIRLPRVLAAMLVGGGLAVAGASLQNVTRNGLADPYLFGVVAGAGLGAAIVTVLPGLAGIDANWLTANTVALPLAAFVGAAAAVLLVQSLSASSYASTPEQLLLAGVAVSLMLGALTHFVLYLGEPFAANKVMFWLMGSLSRVEHQQLWLMFFPLCVGIAMLWLMGRHFDAMLMGDDTARSLGVNPRLMRGLGMAVCAWLTAVVVACCGGIGFVGLMIPHIVRRWVGVSTRQVIPASMLLGGIFLVWADVLARTAAGDHEIPIGIITSAVGSVFFLLMMRARR